MIRRFLRVLRSRVRLAWAIGTGVACGVFLPGTWSAASRFVCAWDAAALTYLILAMAMIWRADAARMRKEALSQDDGAVALLIITIGSALASVVVTFAELAASHGVSDRDKGLLIALGASTLALSWAFVHTVFALHYAHEFERGREEHPDVPWPVAGGLDFQSDDPPDYPDFLYFSFIIGVASQTADVIVKSKTMRRLALAHGVVSFWFNAAILAMAINVAASAF